MTGSQVHVRLQSLVRQCKISLVLTSTESSFSTLQPQCPWHLRRHIVEQVSFFMATAHSHFSIEKGDVKNALFPVTFEDVPPGELAAEPVPALRKALILRDDDIVMLTTPCYGLIDAPRRWWQSLVRDTQQLGWRSCRHQPCLMTWHVRGRLKGLMCSHVDNIVLSGPAEDSEFRRMMDKLKRLHGSGEWERHEFDQCGCRLRQATHSTKRSTLEKQVSSQCLHVDTTLTAKRGELNWLATQSMTQLLAPLSLIRSKFQGNESTCATSRCFF